MSTSPIVEFYCRQGTDCNGRRFGYFMQMNDEEREYVHDYIQWMFPLMEGSRFNPDAPVLTTEDVSELTQHPTAQYRLHLAMLRMQVFYHENKHWRVEGDHNHIRITRILKCLTLLGAKDLAKEFYDFLCSCEEQSEFQKAWPFWHAAMQTTAPAV